MKKFQLVIHFRGTDRVLDTVVDTTNKEDFAMSSDNKLAYFTTDGGKTCYIYPTDTISRIKCKEVL
jgi:hypothetical protein